MIDKKQLVEINYRALLKIILSRWYWIISSLLFFYLMGFLYLKYTPATYTSEAALKFDEKKSELTELINVRNLYDRTNKVESEKSVIRSREVLLNAKKSLDYQISYFKKEKFITKDLYPLKPIEIEVNSQNNFKSNNGQLDLPSGIIRFQHLDLHRYRLTLHVKEDLLSREFEYEQMVKFANLQFRIRRFRPSQTSGDTFFFKFNSDNDFLVYIKKSLKMDDTQNLNVLNLKISDHNPHFAADALNAIMISYLKFDKSQRSISATQTTNFIDTLLNNMSSTLTSSGLDIERFKENSELFEVSTIANATIEGLTKLETEERSLEVQSLLIKMLQTAFNNFTKFPAHRQALNQSKENVRTNVAKSAESTSAPNLKNMEAYQGKTNINQNLSDQNALNENLTNKHLINESLINANLQGITDPQLNNLLLAFNELLLRRKSGLEIYKPASVYIKSIDIELTALKRSIDLNIREQLAKNQAMLRYLSSQINLSKVKLNALPKKERNFITLQSAFNVNQKIHAYLSEKKLESQITKASLVAGAIILDPAVASALPIAPIPGNVYSIFLLIGFVTGLGAIFIIRTISPYLFNRETILALTSIPISGLIRKLPVTENDKFKVQVIDNPRSRFSESIRSLRTNLSFLDSENKHKVVCITSEVSGEGKSFTAVNLAVALSLIEKKVVLISADLRKYEKFQNLGITSTNGLSNYLSGQAFLTEILIPSEIKNLSVIPSGPLPPNPAELLLSSKMMDLLEVLKASFHFIIIDTPPIGLVADALPLLKVANVNLFIIRYGVSGRYAAMLPEKLTKEFELRNSAIILNAFEANTFHSPYYGNRKSYENNDLENYNAYQNYAMQRTSWVKRFQEKLKAWKTVKFLR
jgi:tyrosine-protein kinase Etk/Wzc